MNPQTMQMLMNLMGMGSMPGGAGTPQMQPPPPPGPARATDGFPGAGSRMPGAVPPYSPGAATATPPPQSVPLPRSGAVGAALPYQGGGPTSGPMLPPGGGAVSGQVPGQVPSGGASGGAAAALRDPQTMAALQALQAPESENRGPPSPPGAPAGPKAIDPGLLFEALLKLGVHPGQIPSLTKSLGG